MQLNIYFTNAILFLILVCSVIFEANGKVAFTKFECKTFGLETKFRFKLSQEKNNEIVSIKGEIWKSKDDKNWQPISQKRESLGLDAIMLEEKCELHLIDHDPFNALFHFKMKLQDLPPALPIQLIGKKATWDFKIDGQTLSIRFDRTIACEISDFKIGPSFHEKCQKRPEKEPLKFKVHSTDDNYNSSGDGDYSGGSRGR